MKIRASMIMQRSNNVGLARAAALSICLVGLAGCSTNYIVMSRLVEHTGVEPAADVTPSRSYSSVLKRTRTVALRAPDSCANEGAAKARGESTTTGGILQTDCGVEMSELERALARAGFNVVSWDAVRKMVKYENITPVAASHRLGADVLFMINSLERTRTDLNMNARWQREFHAANARGEDQGRAVVPESRARALEKLMMKPEKVLTPGARLSATVNVSAVNVETGQTIWFYEWTHAESMAKDISTQSLIRCAQQICTHADPDMRSTAKKVLDATPIVGGVANIGMAIAGNFYDTESGRDGSTTALTSAASPANREMRVYHMLVRQVVGDLVKQFSYGVPFPASQR